MQDERPAPRPDRSFCILPGTGRLLCMFVIDKKTIKIQNSSSERGYMKILGLLIFFMFYIGFVPFSYADDYETEPNNTMVTADSLTAGVTMNGQLYSSSDQDWYLIPVTSPAIDITFGCSFNLFGSYAINVKDSLNNTLASYTCSGGEVSFLALLSTTGPYYVEVTGANNTSLYSLAITESAITSLESEPNNTIDTADPVAPGIEISGQLYPSDDHDYYSFSLAAPNLMDIIFNCTGSIVTSYTVSIKDNLNNILANTACTNGQVSLILAASSTGTYYLDIGGSGTSAYSFTVLAPAEELLTIGSVSPSCSTGCFYQMNTSANLIAIPYQGSIFDSWSGDCSGSQISTSVIMNSSKNCTANFLTCNSLPVENVNSHFPYSYIEDAYHDTTDTVDGDTIGLLSQNLEFQPLIFDRDITITLRGGYNCDFSSSQSSSIVLAPLIIQSGTMILDKIIILWTSGYQRSKRDHPLKAAPSRANKGRVMMGSGLFPCRGTT
jgi:hypothetical protein